jgi:hypothetical protein
MGKVLNRQLFSRKPTEGGLLNFLKLYILLFELNNLMKGVIMAIAFMLEFPGATLEQYDKVLELMNLGGKTAPHGIFHVSGPMDGGVRVVDVWESAEAFEKFSQEQIAPLTKQAGFTAPPKVTSWPVHNMLTPTGSTKF